MSSTPSTISDSTTSSMHGLRQQILANAATLFPQEVTLSPSYLTFGIVHPEKIFQVVVSGGSGSSSSEQQTQEKKFHAMLLAGGPFNTRILARGPQTATTAEDALRGLLDVTCEALEWYSENLLGKMRNAEECAQGRVDVAMVEGGFRFAAEKRIFAEIEERRQREQ